MFDQDDDIKKALAEYLRTAEEARAHINEWEFENEQAHANEEFEKMRELLKQEKDAKRKFFSMYIENLKINWSQEEIDEWMEKNI